jgi:glycosyltransferase involved in cell wall biosynthesis
MTLQLAAEMRRRGADHRVVALREVDPSFVASVSGSDVPVHAVELRGDGTGATVRGLRHVLNAARALRPDVIQGHAWRSSVAAAVVGRMLGIPSVATLHRVYYRRVQRLIDPVIQRGWDRVVVDSHAVRGLLVNETGVDESRVCVIPNFVAPALFELSPPPLRRSPLRLLMAARYDPIKGHRFLVDAVRSVLEQRPGAVVVDLIGDGPLREEIERHAARQGIGHALRHHGRRSDLLAWLDGCDVVVLPSSWEGFGMILAEGAAAARPAIAFATGGAVEVIEDGRTGVLCPPGQTDALAASILELAEDPARRAALGSHARLRARQKFSPGPVVDAYEQLYASVLT